MPPDPAPPSVNVSYALLDAAIVRGSADEPLVRTRDRDWTHARLLEEVAALGGVLRHLGVGPGVAVLLDLEPEHDLEAVVAALATARLGGVVTTTDPQAGPSRTSETTVAPVVVCSGGSTVPAPSGVPRLVRATEEHPVVEPDLDWAVMLRAGRTDPAAVTLLEPDAAYSPARDVAAQLAQLAAASAPYAVGELRALLQA